MTNLKREIEFPNDYDKKKVDSRTQIRSNAIRDYKAARYGGDIREAMADGVDISSVIATEANDNSKSAKLIANGTQNRFDAQINGQDKDSESKDARVSKADGKTYNILKDRLDAMDKKPQQAVDDLEIGGTNLLTNSDVWSTNDDIKFYNNDLSIDIAAFVGKRLTLSFQFDVDKVTSVSGLSRMLLYMSCYRDDKKPAARNCWSRTFKVGDSFHGRISNTITIPEGTNRIGSIGVKSKGIKGNNLKFGRPKIELGTKATDWSPAPEDSHHHQAFRKGTRFFAHRGAQSIAPENSLPAIRKAVNHAGVEIDIHCTSDGRWVVMHDGTVDRMMNSTGAISSFTFADIRKLRLDAGNRVDNQADKDLIIPSLEEALSICKDYQLIPVVEIKVNSTDKYTSDNYDQLVTIINRFGIQDEMMFISFNLNALKEIKKRMPLVEVSYLVSDITADTMAQAQQLGVNSGIDSNYTGKGVTRNNIIKAHQAGLKVGLWTTKDDSNRQSLLNLGVDFITTNSLSGEKRFADLDMQNHWANYGGGYHRSYVQEASPGVIMIYFNILNTSGVIDTKGTPFAKIPDWAVPTYNLWNGCYVRDDSGVFASTFDVVGDELRVGLNWNKRKGSNGWISGNVTYHV
ncbi:hypothetical protein FC65_GL000852 [Ligilactobacillus acidipiscis DSM 15836]|uniref:GP-PDE domain-containing protein n=1 Tax=Ligilactobacillus acidipiscis DSM 15836 TaxID=1423716 RepID=A0ABR5PQ30_9LACO|nr:glycerophosphodiester phosphodiesterase family protein [Ligilactobacillus acidipiscis]KRM31942.1 hypothetical protein FC65_GL000852 [Ligilactobacillus acidipiscis DSM 15836]GAW63061.1 glycerophosphoryl diester phosphodiesterase [Ligilactobacillus acidipiscis]GEN19655.1 hypothetical protein LAC02_29360 [Ligilactobacillus acidipiscis]